MSAAAGLRETWSTDGPGRYESVPPIVRYVDENALYDATSGHVDAPDGWFGLAGRWIVTVDTRGAVLADRFASRTEAREVFEMMEHDFASWAADEAEAAADGWDA